MRPLLLARSGDKLHTLHDKPGAIAEIYALLAVYALKSGSRYKSILLKDPNITHTPNQQI